MYNSIYPINIRPYKGNNDSAIDKDKDKENNGQRHNRNSGQRQDEKNSGGDNFSRSMERGVAKLETDSFTGSGHSQYNDIASYASNTKNIQNFSAQMQGINIAQILTDFKNTVSAIGTPPEVTEEMNVYFKLIETQAMHAQPNIRLIKSNLKNASLVLDKYISDSLSKPSKVVENWVDTLFLQKIDFSYDEEKINPDFQLKFPEKRQQNAPVKEEIVEQTENKQNETTAVADANVVSQEKQSIKNRVDLPQDDLLKKMYLKAKKYSMIKAPEKSLEHFQTALKRAIALNDTVTQSLIYYDVAKIFDKNDLCIPALKNYYRATKKSRDLKIKTKAHYGMAKIYGDYVKTEPALEHYFVAMSFAGENDDTAMQSFSLSNIANIYATQSDVPEVHTYNDLAENMALETGKDKVIGAVYRHNADNYTIAGEKVDALKYYKESAKIYTKTSSSKNLAYNFEKAADLMFELGKFKKAANLYKKAYLFYESLNDEESMRYVFAKIADANKLQTM